MRFAELKAEWLSWANVLAGSGYPAVSQAMIEAVGSDDVELWQAITQDAKHGDSASLYACQWRALLNADRLDGLNLRWLLVALEFSWQRIFPSSPWRWTDTAENRRLLERLASEGDDVAKKIIVFLDLCAAVEAETSRKEVVNAAA